MKWVWSRTLWGLLLIAGGMVFLLQNLGVLTFGDVFWGVLLGVGGIGFLSVYFTDRRNWWPLIPGIILLVLGVVIILDTLFPGLSGIWSGVVILGGIGLAFLAVYANNRENWWAIIPAGVMVTLAAVSFLDQYLTGLETGGIFFLGLGLTFGLVAILPNLKGEMRWAFIPAGILFLIGLVMMAAVSSLVNYIWPLALILLGLFFIFRTFIFRR